MKSENQDYENLKLQNQLCFPLYSASRQIVNLYTPYLKPLGITYTQYIVLLVLWEENSITIGDLCCKLFLDSGTVTPLIKKMESEGYVKRQRSSKDERVVIVSITEKGMELRDSAKNIPSKVGKCVPLAPEEAFQLYALLYKILDNI